jgi:two-component system, sensor histidine kinase and response regulator
VEYIKTIQEVQKDAATLVSCKYENRYEIANYAKEQNINIDRILYKPFTTSSLFDALVSDKKDLKNIVFDKKSFNTTANVLLVEDNEINQMVAQQNLENFGLEVTLAENGEVAVQKAKESSFDIIFMDLQMPIMDGYEATKKIREFNQNIPIVALSAAAMENDKSLTHEVGMNDHIAKPIDLSELQQILEKYLEKKVTLADNVVVNEEKIITGVAMHELIERVNGNKELAYTLLLNFSKNHSDALTQLDTLDINSKEFNDYMHNLKGVSGNLSMTTIFKYASDIYMNKNYSLLPELKKELHLILEAINSQLKEETKEMRQDESEAEISKDDLLQTIELLIDELDTGSFIQTAQIESVIKKLRSNVNKESLTTLENAFKQFQYPQAKVLLGKIKSELQ